ncbi:MAG: hypothetical protein EXR50_04090 [Dehalococcoidia bacterium]|nr:hypothetical protein [Dehalococcoidia bacterium]
MLKHLRIFKRIALAAVIAGLALASSKPEDHLIIAGNVPFVPVINTSGRALPVIDGNTGQQMYVGSQPWTIAPGQQVLSHKWNNADNYCVAGKCYHFIGSVGSDTFFKFFLVPIDGTSPLTSGSQGTAGSTPYTPITNTSGMALPVVDGSTGEPAYNGSQPWMIAPGQQVLAHKWNNADTYCFGTNCYYYIGSVASDTFFKFFLVPVPTVPLAPSQPPVAAPAPALPSFGPMGYGMQLDAGTDYPRALKLVTSAGFNSVKVQVRWEDMEHEQGKINWTTTDKVVSETSAAGFKLLFSVATAPNWSRGPGADLSVAGPPADMNTYANFVKTLATRYKGRVNAYEIWNEQNLAREWGGPGRQNAASYAQMLQLSYRAIKAADPAALVLVGALTPAGTVDLGHGPLAIDDIDFFRQMYKEGIKGYFDAVAVHPSGFNNPADADPKDPAMLSRAGGFHGHRSFYYRNFEGYREVMVQNGDSTKPLWFTEFGWAVSPNPHPEYAYAVENSEEEQAAYLVKAFEIAKATGYVGAMFIWNLNFAPTADPGDVQAKKAFGIIRPDWSLRPAYNAVAAMPK